MQFKNPTIEPNEDYGDEIEDETPGAGVPKKAKQVDIDNLDGVDDQSVQNTNKSDMNSNNNSVSNMSAANLGSARSEIESSNGNADGY